VRFCARKALDGKYKPTVLFMSMLKDGVHKTVQSKEWFFQFEVLHPKDPARDESRVEGPFGSRDEAVAEQRRLGIKDEDVNIFSREAKS